MDTALLTTLVSSGGAVIVGLAAIGSNTYWTSRAIGDLKKDFRDLSQEFRGDIKDLGNELREFKEVVNG